MAGLSKEELAIREEIKNKFKSEIDAINTEYMDFGFEEICLDGWFEIAELEKIVHLMKKARTELNRKLTKISKKVDLS